MSADVLVRIQAVAAEKGAKGPPGMGAVVEETLARLAGTADGRTVARIVSEILRG